MTIDDQIEDEINREAAKYQPYHQTKLASLNILQVKKYCLPIKYKQWNKLNLLIFFWEKLFKNK